MLPVTYIEMRCVAIVSLHKLWWLALAALDLVTNWQLHFHCIFKTTKNYLLWAF